MNNHLNHHLTPNHTHHSNSLRHNNHSNSNDDNCNSINDNSNNNSPSLLLKQYNDNQTAYISVEGRRKRRRTTLDDAFRDLSLSHFQHQHQQQHQQQHNPTTSAPQYPNALDFEEGSSHVVKRRTLVYLHLKR